MLLASCSSNDDNESTQPESLNGIWNIKNIQGGFAGIDDDYETGVITWTFNNQTIRIDDGKLYLFYNDFWEGKPFNTIVPWLNNEAEMEKMAATNWKILKDN